MEEITIYTKIEAVYAAVVEFFEYYNELSTQKDEE